MEIFNKTKKLFGIKDKDATAVPVQTINKDQKQEGETYKQYGIRVAGLSQGSTFCLLPSLHAVYLGIKKEQQNDQDLQNELKRKQLTEITNTEAEKQKCENELQSCETKLAELKDNIVKTDKSIETLKNESHRRNRPAWIQLIISGVILVPFTLYFFVFYSSVAYSAFFQSFDTDSLGNDGNFNISYAIFNANAIPEAWKDGKTEVLFILLMPIIFLAFGFILNRWEREKKTGRITLLIIVAFVFDTLLAYEICEKIYNVEALTQLSEITPYNIIMAVKDSHFWIIIFLGFVSYLIWGITFSYFIKAIDDLDLNKITLQNLGNDLLALSEEKKRTEEKIIDLRNKLPDLDAKISNLKLRLDDFTRYDFGKIKLELNNFYAGWQQYLASFGKSDAEKDDAHKQFKDFIKEIPVTP